MTSADPSDQKTNTQGVWDRAEFKTLQNHVNEINKLHLRDLLSSAKNPNCSQRNSALTISFNDITLDCTRQKATRTTLNNLISLANACNLSSKIASMFAGDKLNITENRSVLHIALRSKKTDKIILNNVNIVDNVHNVLNKIKIFSNKIRSGELKGYTGKKIMNVISIGIGGSYLGSEFVYQALKNDPTARTNAAGRQLRFYANIDPVGFANAVAGLDPKTTLCIVVSKSFTTRETMMNAELIRLWLLSAYNGDQKCLASHFIAVSANPTLPTQKFGVIKENIFEFWDWVGGRYSVTSAVGMLPLSLHYGYDVMSEFLNGANDIDTHFRGTDFTSNIPVIMGLFGVWNNTFFGYNTRALIPYSESLSRLAAHIQQLDMESNGKRIDINGNNVLNNNCSGEINFGESGTNSQHSFFQLIHQGRTIPVDFIGFNQSQLINDNIYDDNIKKLIQNNHDELMSNYFAQCDALALGKTKEEVIDDLKSSNAIASLSYDNSLVAHKVFDGNRPSSLLLFNNSLNAYKCGQLLSIFEHRTAVQGFIWNICSFDQWGVQLGKILGKNIRNKMDLYKNDKSNDNDDNKKTKYLNNFNLSTQDLLQNYCKNSTNIL